MPAIKAKIKTVRKDAERYEDTKKHRSALRTARNKFDNLIEENDVEGAEKALDNVFSKLDLAVKHNVIHKNKAARNKSNYTQKLNEAKAS